MKKLMLCLFLGLLFVASPVSAERSYKNGYVLRNAVVRDIHVWDKNWTLLGVMTASGGSVKIPDDAFPLIYAACADPGHNIFCVGGQNTLKEPGCWVLWWWPWGPYYYKTAWSCSVGSKAPTSPAKVLPPKTAIKQPPQKNAPAPHK